MSEIEQSSVSAPGNLSPQCLGECHPEGLLKKGERIIGLTLNDLPEFAEFIPPLQRSQDSTLRESANHRE